MPISSLLTRRQAQRWAVWAAVALALAVRLWGLDKESFWFDEAYSVALARYPVRLSSLVELVGPVYTLFLHGWLYLGDTDWLVRLPSALFGTATVYVIYRLGEALWDAEVGLLAAFFLALSPLHVWYSQEARMYALATLLAAIGTWLFWRSLQEGRSRYLPGYVLAMVLALYTHALTVFIVVYHNLCVGVCCLRRRGQGPVNTVGRRCPLSAGLRDWALAQLALGLLAIPWLYGLISQQAKGYWGWIDVQYGPATLRSIVEVLAAFVYGGRTGWPAPVVWGLVLLAILLLLAGSRRGDKPGFVRLEPRAFAVDPSWVFAAGLLAVPLGITFVLSQFRNMFVPRYMVPILVGYVLLLARGVRALPLRWARLAALAVVLLISTWGVVEAYERQEKEDWRGAGQIVAALEQPGDYIFLMDGDILTPFRRYYHGPAPLREVWRYRTEVDQLQALVDEALAEGRPRLWLVLSHTRNLGLKEVMAKDPRLRLGYEVALRDVSIVRFDRVK